MSHMKYMWIIQGILFFVMIFFFYDLNNIFINGIYMLQFFGHLAWAAGQEHRDNIKDRD